MKAMETLQDLIEETKVRTLWWAICIFGIAYFLSLEFRWKVRPVRRPTYLSQLQKKQLSLDDPRISPLPTAPRGRRKIDSPLVEAAVDDFINKILRGFMVDLWYSAITPDKEAPDQVHMLIKHVIRELSGRIKQISLVDLLTRDLVDLIGDHLDIYRRNQSSIGVDVMGTLSFEERDERLRYHLIASKELHPALFSSECPSEAYGRSLGCCLKTQERLNAHWYEALAGSF
ncbi:Phox domain-containing protein [Cinnamomum micranthum f. kanehirae]|uniref:Phox domain-containing protein n=1 Tax=Cinnamomum micranthum f. kanehirae TaxID=337451 RepID=A0A3S3PU63_9MAGN|nr:Phox domain-containing protein [Cinnamomum micranthum f. kanehirae]